MQDLIGVRIALYFKDDIDVCVEILKSNYTVIEMVRDEEKSDTFSPMRLNLVCQMPESVSTTLSSNLWEFPIDKTFEIQVRTIFQKVGTKWNTICVIKTNLIGPTIWIYLEI